MSPWLLLHRLLLLWNTTNWICDIDIFVFNLIISGKPVRILLLLSGLLGWLLVLLSNLLEWLLLLWNMTNWVCICDIVLNLLLDLVGVISSEANILTLFFLNCLFVFLYIHHSAYLLSWYFLLLVLLGSVVFFLVGVIILRVVFGCFCSFKSPLLHNVITASNKFID
jgi:hypothetical protein